MRKIRSGLFPADRDLDYEDAAHKHDRKRPSPCPFQISHKAIVQRQDKKTQCNQEKTWQMSMRLMAVVTAQTGFWYFLRL